MKKFDWHFDLSIMAMAKEQTDFQAVRAGEILSTHTAFSGRRPFLILSSPVACMKIS
jgi:hypothetical protein